MIKTEIVLVLGAGASANFGFPCGRELLISVCDEIENRAAVFEALLKNGFEKKEILDFKKRLEKPGPSSIDEFLEYNKSFLRIGKASIAIELLDSELCSTKHFNIRNTRNWYQSLFDLINTSFETFDQNKLSIITFNYDRSLEEYLFTALKNLHNKSDKECAEKLSKIPIVHLHGKLGSLNWEKNSKYSLVPYRISDHEKRRVETVKSCIQNIKIIHESIKIEENEEFTQAHVLLSKAEQIYILGFGFNQKNVERLRLPKYSYKIEGGTSQGLTFNHKQKIYRWIENPDFRGFEDTDVHTFLQYHADFG